MRNNEDQRFEIIKLTDKHEKSLEITIEMPVDSEP